MKTPHDETPPRRAFVYHYTKLERAIENILPAGRIRLSPVDGTNDPWEIRPEQGGVASVRENLDDLPNMLRELHTVVRQARLACFCQDDPDAEGRSGSSLWGWARDRMWAQYADNHRGVCLWFDRKVLVQSFETSLAERGQCISGDVEYDDTHATPPVDADAAVQGPRDRYFAEYRRLHARARYFRKRLDWVGEREFRLLLLAKDTSTEPAEVPVTSGALVGITVGCKFPKEYEPSLSRLCEALRVPASTIVYSGTVFLNPYGDAALDGLPRPWW